MLRNLITFASTFLALGGGILVTILLVKQLDAPALVFPGVIAILAATAAVGVMATPGRTLEERLRRLLRALEGSGQGCS
jgi:hypothetical protein